MLVTSSESNRAATPHDGACSSAIPSPETSLTAMMPQTRSSLRLLHSLTISLLSLFLFFFFFTVTSAQSVLDSSKLPQCALSCSTLLTAQQACIPPAAPVTSQTIYQSCFCQSNFLAQYKAGQASPMCDSECTSQSDRNQILSWYQGLCANGAAVVTPAGSGNAATSSLSGGAATATGQEGTSNSSGGGGGGGKPSWISTHYRWVIMIVVLFIAGILATILALWLKRRHDRKWATGGHGRETMLTHADAAASLANPHPDAPQSVSQVYLSRHQHQHQHQQHALSSQGYDGTASRGLNGAEYGDAGNVIASSSKAPARTGPVSSDPRWQQQQRDSRGVDQPYQDAVNSITRAGSRLSKTKTSTTKGGPIF